MFNDKDSVVWVEKYFIEKGIVEGYVYIDIKLLEGNYWLGIYICYLYYNDMIGIFLECKIRIVRNIVFDFLLEY